jgi:signal transduction histidine kinase
MQHRAATHEARYESGPEPISITPLPAGRRSLVDSPVTRKRRVSSAHSGGAISAKVSVSATLTHDARNVLAALQLYCELLAEPGVLTPDNQHFAAELRALISANATLVERLAANATIGPHHDSYPCSFPVPAVGIENISVEVSAMSALLAAIAGPCVELEMECLPCPGTVALSLEDLTRILVNLVRNANEAMPHGGRVRVTVQKGGCASFVHRASAARQPRSLSNTVLLCVHDNGSGISHDDLGRIFDIGFTTRKPGRSAALHRGLGLSIVRGLVEDAGGQVRVLSTATSGTRFEIELPLTNVPAKTENIAMELPQGGRR